MTLNTQWKWRDGLATFYYGGYLVILAGWNPTGGVFTPGPSTNQIWISANDGLDWTYLGDAPWSARHYSGYQIIGTTFYFFGGEGNKDIWTYDLSQGILNLAVALNWTEQTSDWGVTGGDYELFCSWVYNGKIRKAGGQIGFTGTPTMCTDVQELNTATWTWTNIGTLPISYASTCLCIQKGAVTWLYGGGRYLDTGHDNFNNTLKKSLDGGVNWSNVSNLPSDFIGLMYGDGSDFGNRLWFLNGDGGAANPGNQTGLWYYEETTDTWIKMPQSPLSKHASSMCTDGANKMFITSGNTRNDVIRITKTTL